MDYELMIRYPEFNMEFHKKKRRQMENDVIKVVVVGEPRCGKTSFICTYHNRHFRGAMYDENGVGVYPCFFHKNNVERRGKIFEIPGNPDFSEEERISHYEEANVIVFMFAIDDPSSYDMIKEKWIPETSSIILSRELFVLFLGTKKDLRDDEQVTRPLALERRGPVTLEEAEELIQGDIIGCYTECTTSNSREVEEVFEEIIKLVL